MKKRKEEGGNPFFRTGKIVKAMSIKDSKSNGVPLFVLLLWVLSLWVVTAVLGTILYTSEKISSSYFKLISIIHVRISAF